MIFVYFVIVWSVLCLAYAATQKGFSGIAFCVWSIGILVVMVITGRVVTEQSPGAEPSDGTGGT